jgi:predicted nucleic acid-binding protein
VIVLDTNVVSEMMKATPAPGVMRWLGRYPSPSLYTTSITQAEIMHGIMLLPAGKRRSAFEHAADAMFKEEFAEKILPFAGDAALPYARIAAARQRAGRPIAPFDAQIAAIALTINAALATRNVDDFDRCGVRVLNPWES